MPSACIHPLPIELTEVDPATGEVRRRKVERRCGNRLASRCPSCSDLYIGDAREVMRSGFDAPNFTWLTLTAPGTDVFGRTHTEVSGHRCSCGKYHQPGDPALGTPVNPGRFDYRAATAWNARASRLFTVFMQKLRRITGQDLQAVRVIEFQRRGLAHVHALIRGDVSLEAISLAIVGGPNPRTGRYIQPTTSGGHAFGRIYHAEHITEPGKLGSYMRKLLRYAVKDIATEVSGHSTHGRRMAAVAAQGVHCIDQRHICGWSNRYDHNRMGKRGAWTCRKHAAALRGWGFRGHMVAATRRWGDTFTTVRARRADYARADSPAPHASQPDWTVIATRLLPRPGPRLELLPDP